MEFLISQFQIPTPPKSDCLTLPSHRTICDVNDRIAEELFYLHCKTPFFEKEEFLLSSLHYFHFTYETKEKKEKKKEAFCFVKYLTEMSDLVIPEFTASTF